MKRIQPSDSRPLSPKEYEGAARICARARALVESRPAYIREHGLDPEIADPAANWGKDAENAIHNLFAAVAAAHYDVINRLRFYTQPFTGYELPALGMGVGKVHVLSPSEAADGQLGRVPPKPPDDWVTRFQVITRYLPKEMLASYPVRMGEIGWDVSGVVANHDTYSYQERLNLLFESGIIDFLRERGAKSGHVNIVEIGGGYGGLAHGIAQILKGRLNYYICDLPESLLFAALYLNLNLPNYTQTIYDGSQALAESSPTDGRFVYVPNYLFDGVVDSGIKVDLAINTLSLVEMSQPQVRYYLNGIKRLIGSTGLFFEQNHDGRWLGLLDCKPTLAAFFEHRHRIKPRTIPVLTKGEADVWSNAEFDAIVRPSQRPFSTRRERIRLLLWRWLWLLRKPRWGISRSRSVLQAWVSPKTFARLKRTWNQLGGRLPS